MTTTLRNLSGSPFSWRVELALRHKGVPYEAKGVNAREGELQSADFLALNPRGKVPVLVDGDDVVYESAAILEFLEDRYPERPRLYPENVSDRTRVRRLICEMDNYWWPAASKLVQNLYFKPQNEWDLEVIEQGRAGVSAELPRFEREVRGVGFAGELGAADYAIYPLLAHLVRYERRKDDLGLTKALGPKLTGMMRAIESLPDFGETYPPHWREG